MAEQESYEITEIEDMLGDLAENEGQMTKILSIYKRMGCEARASLTERDVFHKVMVDTLEGARTWKRGISTDSHFIENGRSIISNEAKKRAKDVDVEMELETESYVPDMKTSHPPAEKGLEDVQSQQTITAWTRKIFELFHDDSEALCYLEQLSNNAAKRAIMKICELTEITYGNVRRRIKDKARKRFPVGIDWWELEG